MKKKNFIKRFWSNITTVRETRVEEAVNLNTDHYKAIEENILNQIISLITKEGTEIIWNSKKTEVFIKNDTIKYQFFVTKTKQRVMWTSENVMDTLPTTESFIETIFKEINIFRDTIFNNQKDNLFSNRLSRLEKMRESIEQQNEMVTEPKILY